MAAEGMPAEKGDCGMCSFRGVRAERRAGLMNGDGGMVTRGDSGRVRRGPGAVVDDAADCALLADAVEVVDP